MTKFRIAMGRCIAKVDLAHHYDDSMIKDDESNISSRTWLSVLEVCFFMYVFTSRFHMDTVLGR